MIVLATIIEGIKTRKDKTLSISISTNEISPEKASELMRLNQSYCFTAFKPDEFKTNEVEALENLETGYEDDNKKTPSQRLRSVLFVAWKQKSEGFERFDDFYTYKMEKIIEHYKSKLE